MPDDPAPWSGLIAELARRFAGPPFPPHLTLVGGIVGEADVARARLRVLAAATPALRLSPLAIGHGATRHQCLYALVRPDPALAAARRAAATAFARDVGDFLPHLSLFYGALDDDARRALDAELSAVPLPPLRVDALALWSTDGDEGGWVEVAREALR
ncbi:MAG TPA: 2'-5' RNA ligase family protein [Planctomycetota bacterium]|nr:2'-5' RNA ligase family protein [Planctomycetota bacterium]